MKKLIEEQLSLCYNGLIKGCRKMTKFVRRAYVNGAIIVLNIIYFLYLEVTGSSLSSRFMIEKGAMYIPLLLEENQYYRLIVSVFMHFGINHLINNMLVLFVLGDILERALGSVKYLIFYLLCGIGANLFSVLYDLGTMQDTAVSAGASGAIFGVVGGLIYAVAINRGRLGDLSSRQLGVLVLITLYHGFTSTGVNNAAHIGGLITGFFLGILFYRRPGKNIKNNCS